MLARSRLRGEMRVVIMDNPHIDPIAIIAK